MNQIKNNSGQELIFDLIDELKLDFAQGRIIELVVTADKSSKVSYENSLKAADWFIKRELSKLQSHTSATNEKESDDEDEDSFSL